MTPAIRHWQFACVTSTSNQREQYIVCSQLIYQARAQIEANSTCSTRWRSASASFSCWWRFKNSAPYLNDWTTLESVMNSSSVGSLYFRRFSSTTAQRTFGKFVQCITTACSEFISVDNSRTKNELSHHDSQRDWCHSNAKVCKIAISLTRQSLLFADTA